MGGGKRGRNRERKKQTFRKQNASEHTIGVARLVVNNMQIFKSSKTAAAPAAAIKTRTKMSGRAAAVSTTCLSPIRKAHTSFAHIWRSKHWNYPCANCLTIISHTFMLVCSTFFPRVFVSAWCHKKMTGDCLGGWQYALRRMHMNRFRWVRTATHFLISSYGVFHCRAN